MFVIGMEEGLFPHANSMEDINELEEERRLCYVAITRAREKVYLTHATSRMYFGNVQMNMPSRFLEEIPESVVEYINNSSSSSFNTKGRRKRQDYSSDRFLDDLEYERGNFSWD